MTHSAPSKIFIRNVIYLAIAVFLLAPLCSSEDAVSPPPRATTDETGKDAHDQSPNTIVAKVIGNPNIEWCYTIVEHDKQGNPLAPTYHHMVPGISLDKNSESLKNGIPTELPVDVGSNIDIVISAWLTWSYFSVSKRGDLERIISHKAPRDRVRPQPEECLTVEEEESWPYQIEYVGGKPPPQPTKASDDDIAAIVQVVFKQISYYHLTVTYTRTPAGGKESSFDITAPIINNPPAPPTAYPSNPGATTTFGKDASPDSTKAGSTATTGSLPGAKSLGGHLKLNLSGIAMQPDEIVRAKFTLVRSASAPVDMSSDEKAIRDLWIKDVQTYFSKRMSDPAEVGNLKANAELQLKLLQTAESQGTSSSSNAQMGSQDPKSGAKAAGTSRTTAPGDTEIDTADIGLKGGNYELSFGRFQVGAVPMLYRHDSSSPTPDGTTNATLGVATTLEFMYARSRTLPNWSRYIDPGIGFHIAALPSGSGKFGYGAGLNTSLLAGAVNAGIGYDLSGPRGHQAIYYYLGWNILSVLKTK